MTEYDKIIERRSTGELKWTKYGGEVLPMWIADMDFRVPECVIEALRERVDHGVFGYQSDLPGLRETLVERLRERHKIAAKGEDIIYVSGLVAALNIAARVYGTPQDAALMSTPIYHPFLHAVQYSGKTLQMVRLIERDMGGILRYEFDFDALEAAITPQTRLLLLCNPHNPIGRVMTRAELERAAEIALRHDLILISDEIHCDLIYPGQQHISIASLAPEIAQRTVTLLAPSKTFNLPGLGFGFAVIPNPELRRDFHKGMLAAAAYGKPLGMVAALAAYRGGQAWLDELLVYLKGNRDAITTYMRQYLPQIPFTQPEGTYLTWLNCRALPLGEDPYTFFLERARVAFQNGADFGPGGEGCVRLNFGCPRPVLMEALDRVRAAVERIQTPA